jgi:AcrR family transcriptional regulator
MLTPRRKSDTYHHGDLKESAVSAGLRIIQSKGLHALGIRKVAERLNVSPAALYRHFEDIEELRIEISTEVSKQLATQMASRRDKVPESSDKKVLALSRFKAIGEAYIDYARQEPKLFEIAFYCLSNPELMDPENLDDQSWSILQESINELVAVKLIEKEKVADFSKFAWSAVHGLAILVSQGFIQESEFNRFKRAVLGGVKSSLVKKK